VDVVKETKEKAREVTSGDREKGSRARKVLVSLAASVASGAAAYAARKAPGFLEDKVLPKLKELASNSGGAVDRAKKVVESAVPAVGGDGQTPPASRRPRLSDDEREKRQRERAQHRRERKAALSK
jgi:hypothetical protein